MAITTWIHAVSLFLLCHTSSSSFVAVRTNPDPVLKPSFLFHSCSSSGSVLSLQNAVHEGENNSFPPIEEDYVLHDSFEPAYAEQPPHAGRHFLPSHPSSHVKKRQNSSRLISFLPTRFSKKSQQTLKTSRFFEGWYYRVTLPNNGPSFAFIFSIEDAGRVDDTSLQCAAVQVMGPMDQYVVQADRDVSKFWAWEGQQGLGCTFEWNNMNGNDTAIQSGRHENIIQEGQPVTALHPEKEWKPLVKTGFQMLPKRLQGRVHGHDGSLGGIWEGQGIPLTCEFDLSIRPLSGWGPDEETTLSSSSSRKKRAGGIYGRQKSTAGWLASYSVFEPHWQVTMADARATGFATWNGTRYEFTEAPFYAEKNWGGAFPIKWYWIQCNSFDGFYSADRGARLSVTAGGGRRKLPWLGGQTEDLGMVCVHYNGTFYEAVPWTSIMTWDVDPWGRWVLKGRCTERNGVPHKCFEVEITATVDAKRYPGVTLRAPTDDLGLVYFCKDSFFADTTLSLYELTLDQSSNTFIRKDCPPIIDNATSRQGGVEIGGGPWWNTWRGVSKMKQPMKALVRLPYRFQRL